MSRILPESTGTPGGPATGDLAGNYPAPEVRAASKTFSLLNDIAAAISGDVNNWNPSGMPDASVVRITSTVEGPIISGIVPGAGADGRIICLTNVGSPRVIFANESTSSTAANRFSFGTNVGLGLGESAIIIYDSTGQRWRLIATSAGKKTVCNVFDVPGIYEWIPPAGNGTIEAILIGSGGGGGSGRVGATSTLRGGGGGGGGGAYSQGRFLLQSLPLGQPLTVTVPAGGAGGIANGGTAVDGSIGGDGSNASLSTTSGSFMLASGGSGGKAGTNSNSGASTGGVGQSSGGSGGTGAGATAGVDGGTGQVNAAGGGGGGGGVNTVNANTAGGRGGGIIGPSGSVLGPAGGAVPGGDGINGGIPTIDFYCGSTGGSGGAGAQGGSAGGRGGNGGKYGAGGGGGGGCNNGGIAQVGGTGGNGVIILITSLT